MVYDPEKQYRCTIIRGRTKNEMDDLLPIYASILKDICPCEKGDFPKKFNGMLSKFISSPTKKTLDNHRTEITGKLFGMWYADPSGLVNISKRAERLLEDGDQPAFFKEISWLLQFPNGMDKLQTIKDRIKNRIRIRPCAFVLKFLLESSKVGIIPTKDEVAYYVLNNLNVLQGVSNVYEVISVIAERRKSNDYRRVEHDRKASSYSMQHISEILNLMELANLIRPDRSDNTILVELNRAELNFIKQLAANWDKHPAFRMYEFNYDDPESVKEMYQKWGVHYTQYSLPTDVLNTRADTLQGYADYVQRSPLAPIDTRTQQIGDEGEIIVLNYEKKRVKEFHPRFVNKVIYFGKQKGLGYDVSSIVAKSPNPEHPIYIEVKSTKRSTAPKSLFMDQFELTRNEWVAAEHHKDSFFVYRVYITNTGVYLYKMQNLMEMKEKNEIYAEPYKYRVEFQLDPETSGEEKWLKI